MDRCKECNSVLNIIKAVQSTEIGSTQIKNSMLLGCVNSDCKMYVGDNQSTPINIQKRIETLQDSEVI